MPTYPNREVRRWLGGVGAIAAAVTAQTPLIELLDLIACTACELTGYEGSGVLLVDDGGERLLISGSHGLPDEYVERVNERLTIELGSGPLAEGPSSRAFREAAPVVIADIRADASFEPWSKVATDHGWRAIVAVPLIVAGEPVGTLNCYRDQVHVFGDDELALLTTLAGQAGIALQSDRLIRSLTEQSSMLEQAEDIHRELTAVALRAGGMQGVTEALARLLARPVLVTDDGGGVAANARYDGVLLAPEEVHGDLPDDHIGEDAASGRVSAPVLLGRDVVARLWVPGHLVELAELQRRALEHAAVVCALECARISWTMIACWSCEVGRGEQEGIGRPSHGASIGAGRSGPGRRVRARPQGPDLDGAPRGTSCPVAGTSIRPPPALSNRYQHIQPPRMHVRWASACPVPVD